MNLPSLLLLLALALTVGLAVRQLWRRRGRGSCDGCGGCLGCPGCHGGSCPPSPPDP
ncbi:MAG: FeoB-associated Cys-rich membrane protein [Clostridiales bacterium]|nr:FeoB-associated Cys-rich membrane protein [Clostridiales bacterium]